MKQDSGKNQLIDFLEQNISSLALFFDLDGTLIDIADKPDNVHVPESLEEDLTRLFNTCGGALAIITGRELDFVDAHFPRLKPPVSTGHGAAIRYEGAGEIVTLAQPIKSAAMQRDIEQLIANDPDLKDSGVWVEPKQYACAIHWRGATLPESVCAEKTDYIANIVKDRTGQYSENPLALTLGDMVIEIGPAHIDKGKVLEMFMQVSPFKGRKPVYFGDTMADLPAIRMAQNGQGIGVCVQKALVQHADFVLESPAETCYAIKKLANKP